jgi:hypothetical protein
VIQEKVKAGDECIETFQNDPLKNLTDIAKKTDWAMVRRVRVIPARLWNWNYSGVPPKFKLIKYSIKLMAFKNI